MALNIENEEIERLANEISRITGETKTEAIRRALAERRARLVARVTDQTRSTRTLRFLETEVWSRVPADQLGSPPDRWERESILGDPE